MKLVFGLKNAGIVELDDFADRIKDAAESSNGIDEWIDGVRSAFQPGRNP